MSAVSVEEIGQGKRRGRWGTGFVRQYSRWFRVRTSSAFDGPDVPVQAQGLGLPARGDSYYQPQTGATDIYALCTEIIAQEQQEDDPRCWLVECQYTSDADEISRENINPLLDAPQWSFSNEKVTEAREKDLDDEVFANSAGVPYQAVTLEYIRLIITLTRNEAYYDQDRAALLMMSCNQDPIWGYAETHVLLQEYSAQGPKFKSGIEYWPHTYVFKVDTVNGWENKNLLDAGLEEFDGTGHLKAILLKNGVTASVPVLLDGEGHARAAGPAVYNPFRVTEKQNWSALLLPSW